MTLTEYLEKSTLTQAALGELLGVSQGAVGQWRLEGRRVPAEHCPAIERITNREVTCEELRPDVDWAQLRNTPSIASAQRPRTDRATEDRRGQERRKRERRDVDRRAKNKVSDR